MGIEDEKDNEELEIMACALFGTPAPPTINTMKVFGYIKNCPVTILIDSGSSHNFVDLGLVKRLKGYLDKWHVFNVKIVDKGKVATSTSRGHIRIQDFNFVSDLYVITLGGCDVVLGVQWLKTLGPILWDFDKLYMQFTRNAKTFCITIPTSSGNSIEDISALQMQRLLQKDTTMGAVLYHIEHEANNVLRVTFELVEVHSQTALNSQNISTKQQ